MKRDRNHCAGTHPHPHFAKRADGAWELEPCEGWLFEDRAPGSHGLCELCGAGWKPAPESGRRLVIVFYNLFEEERAGILDWIELSTVGQGWIFWTTEGIYLFEREVIAILGVP